MVNSRRTETTALVQSVCRPRRINTTLRIMASDSNGIRNCLKSTLAVRSNTTLRMKIDNKNSHELIKYRPMLSNSKAPNFQPGLMRGRYARFLDAIMRGSTDGNERLLP